MNRKRKPMLSILIVLGLLVLLAAGVYLWWNWTMKLLSEKPYQNEAEEVAYFIERHYLLDKNIHADSLLCRYSGAREMVQSLNDPYSELLLKRDLERAVEDLNGSYVGVGFEARKRKGEYLKIGTVTRDSPALAAGLRPNDLVLRIDGEDTWQMEPRQTLSRIKGKEGTTVLLTIQRSGLRFDARVMRAKIKTQIVEHRMLENAVGYLSLSQIPMLIHEETEKALQELIGQGMESLILDLRGNGGGEIEEAGMIASALVPEQAEELFTVTHKTKSPTVYERTRQQLFAGPVYILVNEYTASSAELLTQILKDVGNAVVIGEKTFEKGISQSFFYLESGNVLKLTTGLFHTPGGKEIHKTGITPDHTVPMDARLASAGQINMTPEARQQYSEQLRPYLEEQYGRQGAAHRLEMGDVQLQTALELAAGEK